MDKNSNALMSENEAEWLVGSHKKQIDAQADKLGMPEEVLEQADIEGLMNGSINKDDIPK